MATALRLGLVLVTLGACTPNLAASASPGPGWPDLADPPSGRLDGRSDAALIIVMDAARPGAWEVGSGWWRYLVRTRGLRKARVRMLRNQAASANAISEAIVTMKDQADAGSMLWLIFVGGGESPSGEADGRLLVADAEALEFAPLREQLGVGYHESAFILLDACSEPTHPGYRAGIPASPPAPPPPPPLPIKLEFRPEYTGFGLGPGAARARAQIQLDIQRERTTPRNRFVLTAGTGSTCATRLGERQWPALAYAALGGLQGWADLDGDGWIAARELTIYAQSLLADGPASVTLEAGGVDLILADVAGLAPHSPPLARRRRRAPKLDPGLARVSDAALHEAADAVELVLDDMVAVPGGEFFMGCDRDNDEACERDELPSHNVELHGFAIDRTEVTWAEYRACVVAAECPTMHLEVCWVWTGEGFVRGAELADAMLADDHPVVCVNWQEAARYCEAQGKRLPTEAEWERAARGVDGRIYPWGNDAPTCETTVMDGCSDFTRPVGTLPDGASPVDALDMAGNVSEWVLDWWGRKSYRRGVADNPTGPRKGEVRGVRGGSFYNSDADLRVSYRYGLEPDARTSIVGFRCVR